MIYSEWQAPMSGFVHINTIVNINRTVNMARSTLGDADQDFINEIAALFAPWGMVGAPARIYGYLLLKEAPVSLDQIAADLRISKVGAWKAARSLEDFGHVRRYGEPGSKRALYGPTDSFEVPFVKQAALLAALEALLRNRSPVAGQEGVASRLREMSQFYLSMRQAMEATVKKLNAGRSAKGKRRQRQ